ncbi:MAG TPA: recombinase family protein [Pirellulales bacterium]|nr:recombinase family protein [Pirellulales bacterium]
MQKHVAMYVRVSSRRQDHRSQLPDLERWSAAQSRPVVFYRDKFTGKTMERPGWKKLQAAIEHREVATVVCWRLDRLGRTARGLTALFDDLQHRGINLVSLREGIDLSTPAGRMLANMLASVAQFETECRAERVLAGQAAARERGVTWGGRKEGTQTKAIAEKVQAIRTLRKAGENVSSIARACQVSRPTVYAVIHGGW